MKKQYIQPNVKVHKLISETVLAALSNVNVNDFTEQQEEHKNEDYEIDDKLRPGYGTDFN